MLGQNEASSSFDFEALMRKAESIDEKYQVKQISKEQEHDLSVYFEESMDLHQQDEMDKKVAPSVPFMASSSNASSPSEHDVSLSKPVTPKQTTIVSSDPLAFCQPDTVKTCLDYLNNALEYHALSSTPLSVQAAPTEWINSLHSLLQVYLQQKNETNELQQRLQRLNDDFQQIQQRNNRLDAEVGSLSRQVKSQSLQMQQVQSKWQECLDQLQQTREDWLKCKNQLSFKANQFQHESKKRDREMEKLREKVHAVLKDRLRGLKYSIEFLNEPKIVKSTSTSAVSTHSATESLYRDLLEQYQQQEQVILDQCQQWRDLTRSIYEKFDVSLDAGLWDQPHDFCFEKLSEALHELNVPLENDSQQYFQQQHQEKVHELQEQIEEYRSVISRQNQLLQVSLQKNDAVTSNAPMSPPPMDTMSLTRQREQLAQERAQLTAAALKLSQERDALRAQQAEWMAMRRRDVTKAVLAALP